VATGDIEGILQFGVDTGIKPATYPKDPIGSSRRNSGKFENLTVPIRDARAIAGDLDLDPEGVTPRESLEVRTIGFFD
jgi:hypothetical protein